MKQYYVYMMASESRVLYTGMTSNLEVRVHQHKNKVMDGFTSDHDVTRLVSVEEFTNVDDAIARERQLKRWGRSKKIWLIERENPDWNDLSEGRFDDHPDPVKVSPDQS